MLNASVYLIIVLISFFVAAFVFSLLVNSLFLHFSKNLGVRHHNENLIRWSSTTKPAMGGIGFYIIFLISIAATSFIFEPNERYHNLIFLGFVIAATIAFLMGLFDDAFNTKVWLKLFAQITCSVVLIVTGTSIQFFGVWWADWLLTIIWVVGMMNSLNMLDNMDGISTIVSTFILSAFIVLLLIERSFGSPFTIILAGLIAALLGFLIYNWNPSKMYMGDTGSQFLGFILAFTGILFIWNGRAAEGEFSMLRKLVLLAVLYALPLSDTITVVFKRLRKGRSPFVGGKDHTTHHLSYLGLSDRKVAMVYLFIALVATAAFVYGAMLPAWYWQHYLLFTLLFLAVFVSLFTIGNLNIHKSDPKSS